MTIYMDEAVLNIATIWRPAQKNDLPSWADRIRLRQSPMSFEGYMCVFSKPLDLKRSYLVSHFNHKCGEK